MNQLVYVVNKEGKPIMPTKKFGWVRHVLKSKQAKVICLCPFTIQIFYDCTSYCQPITLGVDTGYKHIGLSASTEKQELYSVEVELRTDISDLISDRRMMRANRRSRKTRYRQPRFMNRTSSKKKGWLAPSILHKEQSHIRAIQNAYKILPISKIIVETASFDIQKIKNPTIQGIEYQHGTLFDFENLKQYVKVRDGYTCQYCKGKSNDNHLEVHHLIPRGQGGEDKPENLITLCSKCHHEIHQDETKLKDLKSKFYKKQKQFKDAAGVSSMKSKLIEDLQLMFNDVQITFGYITKKNRELHNINKTHHLDAFCISKNFNASRLDYYFKLKQVRRHNRMLHIMKPGKGGKRKAMIAPKYLGKSNLERYDFVQYNNLQGFISGSSNGNAVLKDINYNKIINKAIHPKYLKLIRKKQNGFLIQPLKIENLINL